MKKYSLLSLFMLSLLQYQNSFAQELHIESTSFKQNSMIPVENTCYGTNQSPPLAWNKIPLNTKSFALIVDDPDAPGGVWTHWIVFNIPANVKEIGAGAPIPSGAANAKNSWDGLGYRGPCPTLGAHTYHFKLYALDKVLDLGEGTTRDLLLDAMTGHVIGEADLMGIYQSFKK